MSFAKFTEPLRKENIDNKDTARLLKAHFEQENNIIDANVYFALEQEFYLDLVKKKDSKYPNRIINIIPILFNKYISNYGTDWFRVLIVIFGFSFLASMGYGFFEQTCIYFNSHIYWFIGGFIFSFILYILYIFKYIKLFLVIFAIYCFVYCYFPCIHKLTNNMAILINPLNIFKQKEYFKDIVIYGIFVKAIVTALIYQFIISFKNNTRRK